MENRSLYKTEALMRGAVLYREFGRLADKLEALPYALVKGEALSLIAYQCCGGRIYKDIDLLLPRSSFEALNDILQDAGYRQEARPELNRYEKIYASYSHQAAPYYKMAGGNRIEIDVNFDLFWGEYLGNRIDISEFLQDAEEIVIYGTRYRTLSAEKTFIQICLHLFKEVNSFDHLMYHNPYKRQLFDDIYYFLLNNRQIGVDRLYALCREYQVVPFVYHDLYYVSKLYPERFVMEALDHFRCEEGEALIDCYGLAEHERKRWRIPFETRLAAADLSSVIKEDLTAEDWEKIRMHRKIFGP